MQNTIYLASYGEYSDKGIDCYFTSEEECEKYCQFKNETQGDDYVGDWYVESLECKDGMIDLSNVIPKFLYQFDTDFDDYWSDYPGEKIDIKLCSGRKSEIFERKSFNKIMIQVVTTEKNRDKAVKIAQDMYAKYKAEKNNL